MEETPKENNESQLPPPKIKKKRGRKPKSEKKNEVKVDQPKKKRGRKRKCELNINKDSDKISGFMKNSDTIDTKDNKIQITDQPKDRNDTECENINFGGGIVIKKYKADEPDIGKLHHNLLSGPSDLNKCNIDLDLIVDDSDDDDIKEMTKNTKKMSIMDIVSNKNENEPKHKTTRFITSKNSQQLQQQTILKKKQNVTIMSTYGKDISEWPKTTSIYCWWCCHPFDGPPAFIPTKYDSHNKRFAVTGNFCSWNCAKTFIFNDRDFVHQHTSQYFTSMLIALKEPYIIKNAPPRQALKCFGGSLSIKEFRENSQDCYNMYKLKTKRIELDDDCKIINYKM